MLPSKHLSHLQPSSHTRESDQGRIFASVALYGNKNYHMLNQSIGHLTELSCAFQFKDCTVPWKCAQPNPLQTLDFALHWHLCWKCTLCLLSHQNCAQFLPPWLEILKWEPKRGSFMLCVVYDPSWWTYSDCSNYDELQWWLAGMVSIQATPCTHVKLKSQIDYNQRLRSPF